MKKYFFLILVFFSFQKINATHNLGGEIILTQLDNKKYEAKLITYTRFIPSDPSSGLESLVLCWGDGVCESIPRDTFYMLDCELKQSIYKNTHTYSDVGSYIISMNDQNRGSGIINVHPPISHDVAFHVQTKIAVTNSWNRFPIFRNHPTDVGQVNTVLQHNPAAVDLDGDSLSYSLVEPMQGINDNILIYFFPDEILPGSNNNLTIDEETGTITWDAPQVAGYYTIAILIKEHRNGIILSETIRDFRVTIEPTGTVPNFPPLTTIDFDEVTLSVGDEFNFEVLCDELEGENIMVQSFGLPHLGIDPAQFSPFPSFLQPPVTGNFSWTITAEHTFFEPYYIIFRTEEDELNQSNDCGKTSYQVLKININEIPTNASDLKNTAFQIFPNPIVQQQLNIELPKDMISKQWSYKIINPQGQIIKGGKLSPNPSQQIDIQQLSTGNYFFILQNENGVSVKKITKVK